MTTPSCVWEITEDRPATQRFSLDHFTSRDDRPPTFVIGESDPSRDWPRIHPGPLNSSTDFSELSATIEFAIDSVELEGNYALELEAREASGPCPDLLVEVNDSRGLVILQPTRTDRSHDPWPPSPTAGTISKTVYLPSGALRVGTNCLVITTVARENPDPAELSRQQRPDLGSWFGSTLHWTRLALVARAEVPEPKLEFFALPLYVNEPTGLHEVMHLVLTGAMTLNGGTWQVEVDGFAHSGAVRSTMDFGDHRTVFHVPASTESMTVKAAIDLGIDAKLQWAGTVEPSRKWTVHILPHVHLDLGYTDRQAKVVELHNKNLDKAIQLCNKVPEYAYSVDGSFVVQQFLRSRSAGQVDEFVSDLRSGRITTNAFWALLLTGVAGLEDLYRALYFSSSLRREYGIGANYANLTDVPSYSWAIPSILASAGIDSFMGISNHTRGGNADSDELHLASPVVWSGPDGGSVLAFFADCYSQLRFVCADPPTIAGCAQGLTSLLNRYERPDYAPDHFPLVGTHADNEDLSHGYADLLARWSKQYAWPRLVFSTMGDYFEAVSQFRDRLPRMEGDGGSYWEDGVGTQAVAIAQHRRNQTGLVAVEAVSCLVTLWQEHLRPDFDVMDEAWETVLIGSEHTWTSAHASAHPHSATGRDQLDWKLARISRGAGIIADERQRALAQLSECLNAAPVPGLIIVNSLSWKRDGMIEVELMDDTVILDEHGTPVPAYPVTDSHDGLRTWRVLVPEMEAFGYRMLPLADRHGTTGVTAESDDTEQAGGWRADARDTEVLETPFFSARFEPGTGRLASLHHRTMDRELVDANSSWSMGELLYATGGANAELPGRERDKDSLYDYDPALPIPDLRLQAARTHLRSVARTPWGWTATIVGDAPSMSNLVVQIHLSDTHDQVDIDVEFDKAPVRDKEAVYVAFPFAVPEARLRFDRQQGWVDPSEDHHPGACNEWFTTQNAVVLEADDVAVAWSSADAPLFALNDIVRGTWPTRPPQPSGTVLSWVMNNYWWTNTPAHQQGHMSLRYRFRAGREADLDAARRAGRELRTSLLVSDVLEIDRCDDDARPWPVSGSLYRPDVPAGVEVTVFGGRFGEHVVMRAQETKGVAVAISLPHPRPGAGASAHRCTPTEDMIAEIPLDSTGSANLRLDPHEVVSIAFRMSDNSPSSDRSRA